MANIKRPDKGITKMKNYCVRYDKNPERNDLREKSILPFSKRVKCYKYTQPLTAGM